MNAFHAAPAPNPGTRGDERSTPEVRPAIPHGA